MINPLLSGHKNAGDFPLLGQTFLTSAYIMVDYDKNEFTLWQANATSDEDLVVMLPSSTCKPVDMGAALAWVGEDTSKLTSSVSSFAASSATSSAHSSAPSSAPSSALSSATLSTLSLISYTGPTESARPELSGFDAGAGAGTVIGGIACLVMLGLVTVHIPRSHKRKASRTTGSTSENNETRMTKDPIIISGVQLLAIQELPGELNLPELGPPCPHGLGYGLPHELSAEPSSPALRS